MTKKTTKEAAPKKVGRKTSSKKATSKPSVKTASVTREEGANDQKTDRIAFSIDDIEALVATRDRTEKTEAPKKSTRKKTVTVEKKVQVEEKPVEKRILGAASHRAFMKSSCWALFVNWLASARIGYPLFVGISK